VGNYIAGDGKGDLAKIVRIRDNDGGGGDGAPAKGKDCADESYGEAVRKHAAAAVEERRESRAGFGEKSWHGNKHIAVESYLERRGFWRPTPRTRTRMSWLGPRVTNRTMSPMISQAT